MTEERGQVPKLDNLPVKPGKKHDKKNIKPLAIRKFRYVDLYGAQSCPLGDSMSLMEMLNNSDFTEVDAENIIIMAVGDQLWFTDEDETGVVRVA